MRIQKQTTIIIYCESNISISFCNLPTYFGFYLFSFKTNVVQMGSNNNNDEKEWTDALKSTGKKNVFDSIKTNIDFGKKREINARNSIINNSLGWVSELTNNRNSMSSSEKHSIWCANTYLNIIHWAGEKKMRNKRNMQYAWQTNMLMFKISMDLKIYTAHKKRVLHINAINSCMAFQIDQNIR